MYYENQITWNFAYWSISIFKYTSVRKVSSHFYYIWSQPYPTYFIIIFKSMVLNNWLIFLALPNKFGSRCCSLSLSLEDELFDGDRLSGRGGGLCGGLSGGRWIDCTVCCKWLFPTEGVGRRWWWWTQYGGGGSRRDNSSDSTGGSDRLIADRDRYRTVACCDNCRCWSCCCGLRRLSLLEETARKRREL